MQTQKFAAWEGVRYVGSNSAPDAIENAQLHLQSLLGEIQGEFKRLRPFFSQEEVTRKNDSLQEAYLRIAQLTLREKQVWTAIAMGHPTKLIAHELSLTFKTVVGYRTSLMKKLGLHSVADLTRLAMLAGLLTSSF